MCSNWKWFRESLGLRPKQAKENLCCWWLLAAWLEPPTKQSGALGACWPSPRAVPAARWSAHLGAVLCPARAAAGLAWGAHPWARWAPALAPRCPPRCPAPGTGFQQRSLLNFPWPAFVEGCEAALVVAVYLFIFTKCSETPRVVNFGGVAVQSEKP